MDKFPELIQRANSLSYQLASSGAPGERPQQALALAQAMILAAAIDRLTAATVESTEQVAKFTAAFEAMKK